MCRSCADHASSGRSRRRCTDPASAAAAARSNHAVLTIERAAPEALEPLPVTAAPSVNVPRLQRLIHEALGSEGYDPQARTAALAEIERTYGSVDLAVAAVGATIQARAEELAGITGDEIKANHDRRVTESLGRYEGARAAVAAQTKAGLSMPIELLDEMEDARDGHKAAKAGTDGETAEEMSRLIEGRVLALSEILPLGGELSFAPRSNPEIVAALNGATRYYPSSWVAISNSGQKILATATHKAEGFYLDRRKVVVEETSRRIDTEIFSTSDLPLPPDPQGDFTPTGEKHLDREIYSRELWRVANKNTPLDASGKPTTELPWEEWVHPTTGEVHWRTPLTWAKPAGSMVVSEIQVGITHPANVAGMDKLHAVAVHEQAHRFEGVINGVEALEDMFLTRRTTLPDGTLEKVQEYCSGVNVRADHFSEKYTGRKYKGGGNELLSTGMEAVFAGQYGGFLGIGGRLPDTELQNFVLGVLATCDGKRADC
ncbi:MAG TPA: hypothetical protein VF885_22210 [Arthrobacter sp.]